jgi:hypothetical protein
VALDSQLRRRLGSADDAQLYLRCFREEEWKALKSGHLVLPSTDLLFSNPCTDNLGLDFRYHDPSSFQQQQSHPISCNTRRPQTYCSRIPVLTTFADTFDITAFSSLQQQLSHCIQYCILQRLSSGVLGLHAADSILQPHTPQLIMRQCNT